MTSLARLGPLLSLQPLMKDCTLIQKALSHCRTQAAPRQTTTLKRQLVAKEGTHAHRDNETQKRRTDQTKELCEAAQGYLNPRRGRGEIAYTMPPPCHATVPRSSTESWIARTGS